MEKLQERRFDYCEQKLFFRTIIDVAVSSFVIPTVVKNRFECEGESFWEW